MSAARNNSVYILCFYDDRQQGGPYYQVGRAWEKESAVFQSENSDRADLALIVAAFPCPDQLPR